MAALYRSPCLISHRMDSKALGASRRKENSSRRLRRRLRGRSRRRRRLLPVKESRPSPLSVRCAPQDRLTHVQVLFTWDLSPPRPSIVSLEYLLLSPRSAPGTPLHPGSRRGFVATPAHSYSRPATARGRTPVRTLERHPFSGPIDSAGELLHTP